MERVPGYDAPPKPRAGHPPFAERVAAWINNYMLNDAENISRIAQIETKVEQEDE